MRNIQLNELADEIRRIEGGFGNPLQRPHLPTGIDALDGRLPGGGVAMGAVHELIAGEEGAGLRMLAAHLARRAMHCSQSSGTRHSQGSGMQHCSQSSGTRHLQGSGMQHCSQSSGTRHSQSSGTHHSQGSGTADRYVIWLDAAHDFYPPAALSQGLAAQRLVLLRPGDRGEALWGMDQALRCSGVAAVVGSVPRLSRLEMRRLQLAAEAGGGIGLLLCSEASRRGGTVVGGAASRWRLTPAPSEGDAQRFYVEVEKCRGGRPLPPVLLEANSGTGLVAVSAALADRPPAAGRRAETA